jgi:hypothetical protein
MKDKKILRIIFSLNGMPSDKNSHSNKQRYLQYYMQTSTMSYFFLFPKNSLFDVYRMVSIVCLMNCLLRKACALSFISFEQIPTAPVSVSKEPIFFHPMSETLIASCHYALPMLRPQPDR